MNRTTRYLVVFLFPVLLGSCSKQEPAGLEKLLLSYDSLNVSRSFAGNREELMAIIAKADAAKDEASVGNSYRRLGILYKGSGLYYNALQEFIKAAEISEKTNDKLSSASNANQIGVIYYLLNDYNKSLDYFLKAYREYEEIGDDRGMADLGGNVSEIYLLQHNLESAIIYEQKSLDARRHSGDSSQIGRNYINLANIYLKQNQQLPAIQAYEKAFQFSARARDISPLINACLGLAGIFLGQDKKDLSRYWYHTAYDTARFYQLLPLLNESLQGLSGLYETEEKWKEALAYLKQKDALSDTLLKAAEIKAMVDAERKYDSEVKRKEIAEQQSVIRSQTVIIMLAAAGLLAIIIISYLLIRSHVNKKKMAQKESELQGRRIRELLQQQEIENVNALLKGQNNERKRIAQELHDRLGSMLATVKLHFSNVEDQITELRKQQSSSYQQANTLLDEACREVRQISHDLYEGSLARFGFKTAIIQLIAAIEAANKMHIEFLDNNVPENIYLPFATDLYRITQELLSNTLKYAEARQVSIQFNLLDNIFQYLYEDDGRGFDPAKLDRSAGIGFRNVNSRVEAAGGEWKLDSSPGHGMTLIIEIPVRK